MTNGFEDGCSSKAKIAISYPSKMIFNRKKIGNLGETFMEVKLNKTRNSVNRLNELSGTEWIKFTKRCISFCMWGD